MMNANMKTLVSSDAAALDALLDSFSACMTPAAARRVAAFRANRETQARVAELAEKCNEGVLTPAERREYEAYVRAIDFISIMQAKARLALKKSRKAS
jgi:hypothetical protein